MRFISCRRFLPASTTPRIRRLVIASFVFTMVTFAIYFMLNKATDETERNEESFQQSFRHIINFKDGFPVSTVTNNRGGSQKNGIFDSVIGSFKTLSLGFDKNVKKEMHIFYYAWWGNTTHDGEWIHWNHQYLPQPGNDHPIPKARYHEPPEDIGANFYPLLGAYSSRDIRLMKKHMEWVRLSGADVLVLSWYPEGTSDPNGREVDKLVPTLLSTAEDAGLKLAFHIEPFENRNADSMRRAIAYIVSRYGDHPALYRYKKDPESPAVPMIYVYDSYLVKDQEWKSLLLPHGNGGDAMVSIRDSKFDAFVVGTLFRYYCPLNSLSLSIFP